MLLNKIAIKLSFSYFDPVNLKILKITFKILSEQTELFYCINPTRSNFVNVKKVSTFKFVRLETINGNGISIKRLQTRLFRIEQ